MICIGLLCGYLVPVNADELPAIPEALVQQLGETLAERNLDRYAELLAEGFTISFRSEAGIDPLNREQELDLMRRFLAGVTRFEASFEILSRTDIEEGTELEIRSRFLALDEASDGYLIDSISHLTLVEESSGWQIRQWSDVVSGWQEVRLAFAGDATAVRARSWGALKRQHGGYDE